MTGTGLKRILLVDDEPIVVELLAEGLRKLDQNYTVDTAVTGEEALAKISQTEYALVISDYKMPGLNGLELAQLVREKSPNTRLVIITAYNTENLEATGEHMRVDAYLSKPVSIQKVREIVHRAIGETLSGDEEMPEAEKTLSSEIKENLANLRLNVNARCVLLLSAGGHLIEMAGKGTDLDIANISTMVAANFMAATELAKMLDNQSIFKSSYHEGPNYNVYAYDINGACFLAVIFNNASKSGTVRFYTSAAVEKLGPLLDNIDFKTVEVDPKMKKDVEQQLNQILRRELGI